MMADRKGLLGLFRRKRNPSLRKKRDRPLDNSKAIKKNEKLLIDSRPDKNVSGSVEQEKIRKKGILSMITEISADRKSENKGEVKEMQKLLNVLSHELKNPLHALQNLTDLLCSNGDVQEQEKIILLKATVLSMRELLDSFEGALMHKKEFLLPVQNMPSDIASIVHKSLSLYSLLDMQNIKLKKTISPILKDHDILIDPIRLQQVLASMLTNAIKSVGSGVVDLCASFVDNFLIITVEYKTNFEESRKNSSHSQKGSDSELAGSNKGNSESGWEICKEIARAMSGSLEIRSKSEFCKNKELGNHGNFYILKCPSELILSPIRRNSSIPLQCQSASSTNSTISNIDEGVEKELIQQTGGDKENEGVRLKKKSSAPFISSNLKILIVEDDAVNAMIIKKMLLILGVKQSSIHLIDDGAGVEPFLNSPWGKAFGTNFILSDIVMKEMNGDVLCKKLRDNGIKIPIIATTGASMQEKESHLRHAGFNDIIHKPFTMKDIEMVIKDHSNWRLSIFERVGGPAAVDAAVDILYEKLLKDSTTNRFFVGMDMEKLRLKQKLFLTMAFGGPSKYTFRDLADAHRRIVNREGLSDVHFNAVATHLLDTLEQLKLPADLIEEIMGAVGSLRDQVLCRGKWASGSLVPGNFAAVLKGQ